MKRLVISGLALFSLLTLDSCGGNSGDKHIVNLDNPLEDIDLEGYSYDRISESLSADSIDIEGSKYMRHMGKGVLPSTINGRPVKELRDSLERLGNVLFSDKKISEPRTNNEELKLTTLDPEKTDACSYYLNNLSVTLMTQSMIVWKDYAAYYACGAAHGRYATRYVNFSILDNKIITLNDLFRRGYEPLLRKKLRERLKGNPDVFQDADIQIPETFAVTSEGITFLYGIYDIAPYSAGEIPVSFDAYELTDLLSTHGMQLILGTQTD